MKLRMGIKYLLTTDHMDWDKIESLEWIECLN